MQSGPEALPHPDALADTSDVGGAVYRPEPVGEPKPQRQRGADTHAVGPSRAARYVPLRLPKQLEQRR